MARGGAEVEGLLPIPECRGSKPEDPKHVRIFISIIGLNVDVMIVKWPIVKSKYRQVNLVTRHYRSFVALASVLFSLYIPI